MTRALTLLCSMISIACAAAPGAEADDTSGDTDDGESESDESDTGETGDSETGDGDGDGGSEPLCDGSGLGPGEHVLELVHDGYLRVYQLHVPPGYDGTVETPLVVNLHGLGSNGTQQAFFSYINPLADAEGFVVVYPEGTVNQGDGQRAWNAGVCCTEGAEIDDVGFIRAMLEDIDTRLCIDHARRFSTGMSNGALMSYRLACEAADVFAAIAPIAGALALDPDACEPERAVPLWQIHGTIDGRIDFASARLSAEFWAAQNGCAAGPSVSFQNGVVTCERWDCPAGAEVEFCTAEGVDHCWPGQSFCFEPPSTEDIDSTQTLWDFFVAHPMPG